MRKCGLPYLILAVFALALPVRAAATPEPMPEQVEMHISCRSPMALLQNIDTYVAASTKGTAKAVPPGFIGMMAQLYVPIPLDTWDSDSEVHVIVLRSGGSGGPRPDNVVIVFGASDFSGLVESLEERGWIAGEMIDDAGFESVLPVILPNGVAMVLANLGDGRTAAAIAAEKISAALEGWTPKHASMSDVIVNMALDTDGSTLARVAMQRLQKEKVSLEAAIAESGFKPEFAENALVTLEKYIPFVTDEIGNLRNIVMEVDLDGDAMLLDFSLRSGPGTMLTEIGDALSGGKNVDVSLTERLPAGAATVAVSAKIADILPNTKNRLVKLSTGIYGGIFPEYRDRIAGQVGDFMDSGPGQTAMANYFVDGRQYSLSISRAENPEKALAAIMSMLGTVNGMWASALADPGYGLELVGEERETDGAAYVIYRPVFADQERFQQLMDKLTDNNPDVLFDVAALSRMRFYLTSLDGGAIFSASGELSEDEFVARLAAVKAFSGGSFIATEQAKKALAGLPNSQMTAGVLDGGGIVGLYAAQEIRTARPRHSESEAQRITAAVAAYMKNRKSNGEVVGFGMGAENGWLNVRTFIPAGVVSQVMRDIDGFERASKAKAAQAPSEPSREAEEGEEEPEEMEVADEEDAEAA